MKKLVVLLMAALSAAMITACGSENATQADSGNTQVNSETVVENGSSSEEKTEVVAPSETIETQVTEEQPVETQSVEPTEIVEEPSQSDNLLVGTWMSPYEEESDSGWGHPEYVIVIDEDLSYTKSIYGQVLAEGQLFEVEASDYFVAYESADSTFVVDFYPQNDNICAGLLSELRPYYSRVEDGYVSQVPDGVDLAFGESDRSIIDDWISPETSDWEMGHAEFRLTIYEDYSFVETTYGEVISEGQLVKTGTGEYMAVNSPYILTYYPDYDMLYIKPDSYSIAAYQRLSTWDSSNNSTVIESATEGSIVGQWTSPEEDWGDGGHAEFWLTINEDLTYEGNDCGSGKLEKVDETNYVDENSGTCVMYNPEYDCIIAGTDAEFMATYQRD